MIEYDMLALREDALEYLHNSNFVKSLVRKTIFNSQIDNYYEDYVQECWLSILELKDTVWKKLYETAIEKGTDYYYQVRNYVSRVILNTVRSDSSNAYRKLIKHNTKEQDKGESDWRIMAYNIPDENGIDEEIYNMHNRD